MNNFYDDDILLMDAMFPPFLSNPEISNTSAQVERLNIDTHTQALQLKIEKIKRQRLSTKLKRIKKETIIQHRVIQKLYNTMATLRSNLETYHLIYA